MRVRYITANTVITDNRQVHARATAIVVSAVSACTKKPSTRPSTCLTHAAPRPLRGLRRAQSMSPATLPTFARFAVLQMARRRSTAVTAAGQIAQTTDSSEC